MAKLTPMMRQYLEIKAQYPDAILFFNLGDFYETFFEDAELAARELELVLTKRNEAPMAGVPLKKADVYINRLLKKGYKVAICDQLQDSGEAKGMLERDVVRVVTPGTVLEEEVLERGLNNYIAAILPQGEKLGLAVADLSTGEFRATELSPDELKAELARLQPAELLFPHNLDAKDLSGETERRVAETRVNDGYFRTEELLNHFGLASLGGLGLSALAGRTAAGLLKYLKETQKERLAHFKKPQAYSVTEQMQLDPFTQRNLELVRELGGGVHNTLFNVLNRAVTAMGERLLRRYLLAPLLDRDQIERRLDLVELLYNEGLLRAELREFLKDIYDLERLAGRLGSGRANPRDLLSLAQSLEKLPQLRELVEKLRAAGAVEILEELTATLDGLSLEDLAELLERALREDAPLTLKEGGIIREGFDRELDGLKAQERECKKRLLELEAKERERTGISSLKVGYNTVFGYYIEVTKAHAKRVPQDYIRKQTLVNAERYVTPELKEYEGRITSAAERAVELEYEIFLELRERVARRVGQIQELAELIAQLDCFAALAEAAKSNNYVRPQFTEKPVLEIRDGRHPVVERREEFVPNDLLLKEDEHLVILTGPNMSGKCLTGDALVFTDRGLLPIVELMPRDLEEDQFERLDLRVRGRSGIEVASHFYYGGTQKTIRITTRLGYSIEGTREHPIWIRDRTGWEGWTTLGEIATGDSVTIARDIDLWGGKVAIEFNEPPFGRRVKRYRVPKELNEDLAYLLGLLVGGGTLTYKNGYAFSAGDDSVREEFARINLELFGYRPVTRGNETDLAVTSTYLRSFLGALGLGYQRAHERSIPRAILSAPKRIVAAFLQGLFDTDGYAEKYGNITLSTPSARLAREVQTLLLNFGIISSIKLKKTKARDNYLLSIFGENAIRFYQEIGFRLERKQARSGLTADRHMTNVDSIPYLAGMLKQLQRRIVEKEGKAKAVKEINSIFTPDEYRRLDELIECNLNRVTCQEFTPLRKNHYFYDEVAQVEISEGPVYDLSVPGSHSFVANGFINHNSVYIRQIALIALLAQMGSFVPAREARLPLIDRIFTRVGASDMLASGYSTFMVEMLETANILNNATPRSLIILDEMGRGTSTFDGVSIAWAVAEHLVTEIKAKTLFATHYHELTKLADRVPGVKNMHVRVKEFGNEVIFLHRVALGASEGSYGVHVARLAGLPEEVTGKAAAILERILRNNPLDAMGELRSREPRFLQQLALFAAEEHPVLKRLKAIELDQLTPLEALELLAELRRELG